jgi:hypothetical protein
MLLQAGARAGRYFSIRAKQWSLMQEKPTIFPLTSVGGVFGFPNASVKATGTGGICTLRLPRSETRRRIGLYCPLAPDFGR